MIIIYYGVCFDRSKVCGSRKGLRGFGNGFMWLFWVGGFRGKGVVYMEVSELRKKRLVIFYRCL